MNESLSSKNLDHLGLVSAMYDELEIGIRIDSLVPQDSTMRQISLGTICKALVINGLGFVQRTLYLVSSFFEDKPVELLLGSGVKASHLNDSVLGRGLDSLHAFGTTELFSLLSPVICKNLGLIPRVGHMDISSFHLDGQYNGEHPPGEESQILHLTRGYSRDHRPDLNQVVLNLIVDNQAGIPLHMEALSGNSDDKTRFRETIKAHAQRLTHDVGLVYLVMDSAGYTAQTLKEASPLIKWISRVPETITACQQVIASDLPLSPLCDGYAYRSLEADYAGIKQRWLLVFSQAAYEREIKTLRAKYLKQSQKEFKEFERLSRQAFGCEKDAEAALSQLSSKCKYLQIQAQPLRVQPRYTAKGRPVKGSQPDSYDYYIQATVCSVIEHYQQLARHKGRFIIASNELDPATLNDLQLFTTYKQQSKPERGFRFLKDPQFVAASFFVKKPERVEALVFIMTLCLTVYAAIEFKLRKQLQDHNQTLPNQLGKPVQNITARWLFAIFKGIHILYLPQQSQPIVLNLTPLHAKALDILGQPFKKYYFSSG